MRLAFRLALLLLVASPAPGVAQERAHPSRLPDELVSSDPLSDDPIGIDDETDLSTVEGPPGPEPAETPEEIARRGPRPPSVAPQSGEIVTAINAVRETHHDVNVILADGMATVTTELTISSRARHPAEMRYRLAVPEGAALASLEVCVEERCRPGVALGDAGRAAYDAAVRARGPEHAPPIASAEHARDVRGSALLIHAAPVPPRGALIVRASYVTPAPVVGGVARLTLPGRGQDPRAAPTTVRVRAPSMIGVSIDDQRAEAPIVRDAWYPITMAAQLPTGATPVARVERFACGAERCARAVVSAGPRGGEPVDLVLALDASPSTEGPARSRIAPTVAAILSAAPRGSRVWALSFGARARALLESPHEAAEVPLVPLARAANRELGSATRVEAAIGEARRLLSTGGPSQRPAHLVIIGDGGITRGAEAEAAFEEARSASLRVSVVDVADRAPWPEIAEGARATGGIVVSAGAEAELAVSGRSSAELEERISRLFAPEVARRVALVLGRRRVDLGALVAGEQLHWEGVVPDRARIVLRGVPRPRNVRATDARAVGLAGLATGRPAALFAIDPEDGEVGASGGDAPCIDERGPARRASGVSADAAPVALAFARSCAGRTGAPTESPAAGAAHGRGVPAETVLRMLRQRVRPVARRCFRRDRAGRLDYSARAEFMIRLEDRELTEARVEGAITPTLRACLLDAAHHLDVPRFRGAVVVRYPLFTERAARPPVIELVPEVAREVDALIPAEEGAQPSAR